MSVKVDLIRARHHAESLRERAKTCDHIGDHMGFNTYADHLDVMADEIDRLRGEFQGHSQAAVALYDDIYRIVESTRGTRVPEGCSPREAVSLMAGELSASRHDYRKMRNERDDLRDQLEEAIKMIPTNGLTDREAIRAMIRIKAGQ